MACVCPSLTALGAVVLVALSTGVSRAEIAHRKFEYKYSFKGPYLSQKDGSVPFWEYSGSTIVSEEMVRITPSLRSRKGAIWTKMPTNFMWWEVELVFRVSGRGRVGADGLAFWYTSQKLPEGNTFGCADTWQGLGVFFDSFDNDNRNNNPYIMAMLNDGTKHYDHLSDGISQQLAGCRHDFRNKRFPVKAKIEYFQNVLTISFHSGNTNSDDDYELCLRVENVVLPAVGHFGASAATGGLADDHDVLKFLTTSLYAPGQAPQVSASIAEPEKEKFSKEYEVYKAKLEHKREEYRKQHPHLQGTMDQHADPEKAYETMQNQELRQIFDVQSHMYEGLRAVHRKLDELLGRQERTLSMVGMLQQSSTALHQPVAPGVHTPPPHQQPVPGIPIQRHEVDSLLVSQRDLVSTMQLIRQTVLEIAQKSTAMNGASGAAGGVDPRFISEMRDSLNVVKRDVASTLAAAHNQKPGLVNCPQVSCVSTVTFFAFTCVQLVILLGYMVYRSSRSDAAKKFY